MKSIPLLSKAVFFGLLATVSLAANPAGAQGSMAMATATYSDNGDGTFHYDINLVNSGSTLIGTFWLAWVPGADFLPTMPTGFQSPSGWTGTIAGGSGYYPNGYSIEFYAYPSGAGFELAPGNSMVFGFDSADSPDALAGYSPYYSYYPALTSFIYTGYAFSDPGYQFAVQIVPEPSSMVLLATGSAGMLLAGWRRKRALARK